MQWSADKIGKVDLDSLSPTFVREVVVGGLMGLAAGALVGLFGLWQVGSGLLGLTPPSQRPGMHRGVVLDNEKK